jgi:hypothetical protein
MVNPQDRSPSPRIETLGAMPKPVRKLRALVIIMAVWLGVTTETRIGIIDRFGANPGISLGFGKALLATVGFSFALGCLALFFLLPRPARLTWWLTLLVPVFAAANFAVAIAVLPEANIGVATVLDVYLLNGLLPIAVVVLLLRRAVRAYFGISRNR